MRRHPRLVYRVKTQGVELLEWRKPQGVKPDIKKWQREKKMSYVWVCPDSRVVVSSVNTDQTDSTSGRRAERKQVFSDVLMKRSS